MLAKIIALFVTAWLAAMVLVVAFGLIGGRIRLTGLLSCGFSKVPSQGRMQAMLISVTAIATYAALAIGQLARSEVASLPPAPDWMLYALGGSHLAYLGGKASAAARILSSLPTMKG